MVLSINTRNRTSIFYLIDAILIFLLVLLLNLQWLGIEGWVEDPADGSNAIKIYHLFLLIVLFYLMITRRLKYRVPTSIFLFFSFIIIWSCLAYFIFPINKLIVHYFVAFLFFYCAYYFQKSLLPGNDKLILKMIKQAYVLIYILMAIKLTLYWKVIYAFLLDPYGHPILPTFYGGGPNLEASWIAMSSMFFIKKRKSFYLVLLFSLFISITYSSRVGLILTITSYGLYFFSEFISRNEKKLTLLFGGLTILIFIAFSINYLRDLYLIQRFTEIGTTIDQGSIGRLMLWGNGFKALLDNYFLGYGAGNAIYAVEYAGNIKFTEDNVHNYYLQILLDFGLIGLFIFLLIFAKVSVNQFRTKFSNEFGNFLILYFIGSLVQFRGAEPLLWFIAGLYFSSIIYKKEK